MGKIIYGNRNFGYAPIVAGSGSYSFGAPVMLPGLVSASAEVERNESQVYADDAVYCVLDGAKVRSLTATLKYINEAYSAFLGFKAHDNGMLTDTGIRASHCVFFETEEKDCETGTSTTTLHYFYNVQANEPALESSTTEEEIESADLAIEYTARQSLFVADKDGAKVAYAKITRTSTNATLYDKFKSEVILPTSTI